MAGIDQKKQLLTLIRDCASEKSQGERRVIGLKKRLVEIRTEVETENAELEASKRLKETIEQQLKGFEVELALNVAFIQSLEARVFQIQDEISSIGSEVDGLKNEERTSRDEFIEQMVKLGTRIRRFQEKIASEFQKENSIGTTAETENKVESDSRILADMVDQIVSQTTKEEQEYLVEQIIQKQVQQEYVDLQEKVSLMGMIMKETKALQDLTRYP
ncbi:conserved hypothetical protein [Ricinus communis]|uniref:Uncharacterized protein n=1 Tax=Ricinus communis TaxID=3988 RepID=B9RUI0_RICCO|nr:conserved hypothetical protein [Ricinus communis]|eukprot:XP_002517425.1 uncharacterized protein LOC8280607 [Ricinus communis]